MKNSALPVVAAALLGLLLISRSSYAQQPQPSPAELQRKIEQLEQRIQALEGLDQKVKVLDRRVEVQQEEERQKASETPTIKADSKGISVASPDGAFNLRVHGLVQADGAFFANGTGKPNTSTQPPNSTFELNKVRPIFEGTFARYYDYYVMPDFGQGRTVLQEAWADAHYFPDFRIQAGKFKAPFGLERLQQDSNLFFIQRGLTNNLVPNRDLGISVHSDALFDNRLTYQLALMNGVPNNTSTADFDNNDAKDFVGRLFALPFKDSGVELVRGLGVGFAGTFGDERGASALPKFLTAGQAAFFSYGSNVTAAGPRYRYSPQGYYYAGPFGLLAEYVNDTQREVATGTISFKNKKKQTVKVPFRDFETFANHAWQVQAGYLLTGEDESYYGIKPFHDFDPSEGRWGAFEIKSRVGGLGVDSDIFKDGFASASTSARTATEFGGGLNWYLNRNLKLSFEYLRTFFDKGAVGGKDRRDESAFLTQAQFLF